MCGIAGVRWLDGRSADASVLRAMAETMTHRGPDGWGSWCHGPVGLAHRRLAIIDPAGSEQPMESADGSSCVSFNGEILNYRELRATLPYPYRTNGDTEVLLALHERGGPAAVDALRGQFAYAYYDGATDELWLHRDRMGILPLYYYADEHLFAFASELKALLVVLPRPAEVDHDSLDDYLAHRSVPAPHTLIAGVRKLPQGCSLRLRASGRFDVHQWWVVPQPAPARGRARLHPDAAVSRLDQALGHAVSANLVADVPVGALLSGGVDSGLITALAAERTTDGHLHTFSAGFGDPRVDELPAARATARHLGTDHHEVIVDPGDFISLWSPLTRHRDAPLSEPADVAVYRLAEAAREHVKVILSGEGSDELFAGYPKYRLARAASLSLMLPHRSRSALASLVEPAVERLGHRARTALRAFRASGRDEQLRSWFAPFSELERARLLGRPPTDGRGVPWRSHEVPSDALHAMLWTDSQAWLADNLLERGDRMAMAASVELRPPFLDEEVVELAFQLPGTVKQRRRVGKWVVREVARRHLPAPVVERKKAGFKVPLDAWFRGGLRDLSRDLLTAPDSFVGTALDQRAVRRLLDEHQHGRNHDIRIWTLLSLEVWHRTLMEDLAAMRAVRADTTPTRSIHA